NRFTSLDDPVGNRIENGRMIYLVHQDVEGGLVDQRRKSIIRDPHGKHITSGSLTLVRDPGNQTRLGTNCGARGSHHEVIAELIRWYVRIGRLDLELVWFQFARGLVIDRSDYRWPIHFVDGHLECLDVAQRWNSTVSYPHAQRIDA